MSKNDTVLAEVEAPKGWTLCKKHCACACLYEVREYPSGCPFCKAQHLINPKLVETSPYKNGGRKVDDFEDEEEEPEK